MFDDYQRPVNKKNELQGIYISVKKMVFILVGLIFFFILVFLFGVYMGKREALIHLTQQAQKTETTQENKLETKPVETKETNNFVAPTPNTEGSIEKLESTPSMEPSPPEQTGTTVISPPSPEQIPEQPKSEQTFAPPPEKAPVDNTPHPEQTKPPIELTPLTPPIEQEIPQNTIEKKTPSASITNIVIKQKPRTFSIQLSALTGEDAEKRAHIMVDKLQKKFGNKYLFTIQPTGKFYKIIVINIPDEKTAREALSILSREPDFKQAFIIKPQK